MHHSQFAEKENGPDDYVRSVREDAFDRFQSLITEVMPLTTSDIDFGVGEPVETIPLELKL